MIEDPVLSYSPGYMSRVISYHLCNYVQESFKESHVMDPGKENDKNGDKVLVEDMTPSSTPTVSDSNPKFSNTSEVKKNNKKTNGQKAKSADISRYFKIKTDHG